MKNSLNSKVLHSLQSYAEVTLTGDWVLLGGTLLYLLNREVRVTTDIDLVPLSDGGNQPLLQSFSLAEKLKLPVGSINSAALYFLKKIKNFEKDLMVLSDWKGGRLLRPNLFLFVQLKVGRFTETDYQDCLEFLKLDLPEKNEAMLARVLQLLKSLKADSNGQKKEYLNSLVDEIRAQLLSAGS